MVETVALPADTRRALSGIVAQLRDVPRSIIGDPAEVVHFLGRTARALERLRDAPVAVAGPGAQAAGPSAPTSPPPRPLTVREHAEAVFRPAGETTSRQAAADPKVRSSTENARPRIVMDRKGRGVRVEVRRAREAGQMEMPW